MTSLKPYLLRAVYDWIIDNDFTPHLLVSAEHNNGNLPEAFVEEGKIVLNIKPQAVDALSLGNELIEFNAKFGGKPMLVMVSINAVMAIYAKENGKGLVFEPEPITNNPTPQPDDNPPPSGKPTLRVVK